MVGAVVIAVILETASQHTHHGRVKNTVSEHAKAVRGRPVRAVREADFATNKREKRYFGKTSRRQKKSHVTKEGRNEGMGEKPRKPSFIISLKCKESCANNYSGVASNTGISATEIFYFCHRDVLQHVT